MRRHPYGGSRMSAPPWIVADRDTYPDLDILVDRVTRTWRRWPRGRTSPTTHAWEAGMTTVTSDRRLGRRQLALINVFTRWILRVPVLRRLADRQVCELRFAGVRTGRSIVLPVIYARQDDRLVVLVGGADQKSWCRNFRQPRTVQVLLAGTVRTGTGRVVGLASPERAESARLYSTRFPGVPVQTDPMII